MAYSVGGLGVSTAGDEGVDDLDVAALGGDKQRRPSLSNAGSGREGVGERERKREREGERERERERERTKALTFWVFP